MKITKEQAKKFIMLYHALLGKKGLKGKRGVEKFINHIGVLQYDPIDVCGKSAEIVLQSRIKSFKKEMLFDLLYKNRKLIDYFDKCLCIFPVEDFPYLKNRMMRYYEVKLSADKIEPICEDIKKYISKNGAVSSKDLDYNNKVDWFWKNETKLSRAALEHLYYTCEIGIAYKKGTIKYYDLIEKCIKKSDYLKEHTFEHENERFKWHIFRRIKAVGFIWNKASDAWLNIHALNQQKRSEAFSQLLDEGLILEIEIENIKEKFYIPSSAYDTMLEAISEIKHKKRCEFIAPLDSLIWDRKLIKTIFNFEYTWEIYKPKEKRIYGHYVLPIIYGSNFVGRIEIICEKKNKSLKVENIWLEQSFKKTKTINNAITKSIESFATFNDCNNIDSLCISTR